MKIYSATQIQHWPVCRLQPYDRNPRIHSAEQIEQIASSIREFGFTNPILVDPADALRGGGCSVVAGRSWAQKSLVIAQIAVSIVLLSAAKGVVSLSRAQLSMLLEGIDWRRPIRTFAPAMAV